MNLIDVSGIAAYMVWTNLNPQWNSAKQYKRRVFLRSVSESLILPHIRRRSLKGLPHTTQHYVQKFRIDEQPSNKKKKVEDPAKKKRCYMCPTTRDRKQRQICDTSKNNVCNEHSITINICAQCNNRKK